MDMLNLLVTGSCFSFLGWTGGSGVGFTPHVIMVKAGEVSDFLFNDL